MSLAALTRDLTASPRQPVGVAGVTDDTDPEGKAQQAFDALAKFIPAEMLAPFAVGLSLAAMEGWSAVWIYRSFVIATPFVFLLLTYAQTAKDKDAWPQFLPTLWRGVAATIAFAIWALSVPGNPYQEIVGGAAVAGFAAIIVSPLLTASDWIVLKLLR